MGAELFRQYLQPVKSVDDYMADMDQRDLRRAQLAGTVRQNALADLAAQQTIDQTTQRNALRAAVQGGLDLTKPENWGRALTMAPDSAPAMLDAIQKSQSGAATAAHASAQADEIRQKMRLADRMQAIQTIGGFSSPTEAVDYLNSPRATGIDMNERSALLRSIPQDPAQFNRWQMNVALGLMAPKEQVEARQPAFTSAGDVMVNTKPTAGPVGRAGQTIPMGQTPESRASTGVILQPGGAPAKVDQGVVAAKSAIAAAGAPKINVNTEKTYAGHVAEGLAKQDVALIDASRAAPDRIRSALDVKRILTTEAPITGTLAEWRLGANKALATAGMIDGDRVKSTEDLASVLASQTLDAIKTSGLGSGQGFTDKDRQFLERARSGNIEINHDTLYRIADLNEQAARRSIIAGNKVSRRLRSDPNFGTVGAGLDDVQAPDAPIKLPTVAEIQAEAARRAAKGGR